MTQEIHTQITAEEIAQVFDEEPPPADLSIYAVEDWVTMAVFWGMGLCVFLQFFTRYALNDSLAWTEEIAINCLVVVVFLGSVMCTRMTRHIHVDMLYRYLPAHVGRVLALAVSLISIGFFAYMFYLLRSHVPSNDASMIALWAGLGSACMTGVFWLAVQMFRVVFRFQRQSRRR